MALVPHLSLCVIVLAPIMAWIGFPYMRSTWMLVFVSGVYIGSCLGGGVGGRIVRCGWVT